MKLCTKLCLQQFCLTHLSLRAKSYRTNSKEVLYETWYEAHGLNHGKMLALQWWAESAPLSWDRFKVSENSGATVVALVAPAVTSLRLH